MTTTTKVKPMAEVELVGIEPVLDGIEVACGQIILAALEEADAVRVAANDLDERDFADMVRYLDRRGVTLRYDHDDGFPVARPVAVATNSETCGADPNGWNVYRFIEGRDETEQEFLGSSPTRGGALALAAGRRGVQIQRGLDGAVEVV